MSRIISLIVVLAMPVFAEHFHLNPATLVPAATGDVNTNKDSNGNTTVDLKVEHLARASDLTPSMQTYVVWIQPTGGTPQNEGQLTVDKDLKGELKTSTPLKNFDVFVTAENDPRVMSPRGPEVLRTTIHQGK